MEDVDLTTQEADAIKCEKCGKQFTRRADLKRHSEGCGIDDSVKAVFKCDSCPKHFTRPEDLKRHSKGCGAKA